jgi:hypothetical protein
MQIKATVWGPHIWKSIHYIAMAYPDRPSPMDRRRYKHFFMTLHEFIPCKTCAINYVRHVTQELPPIDRFLDSADHIFEWTVMLHNMVNKELGKPSWTVQQAKEALAHEEGGKSDTTDTTTCILALLSITVCGVLAFFIIRRKSNSKLF